MAHATPGLMLGVAHLHAHTFGTVQGAEVMNERGQETHEIVKTAACCAVLGRAGPQHLFWGLFEAFIIFIRLFSPSLMAIKCVRRHRSPTDPVVFCNSLNSVRSGAATAINDRRDAVRQQQHTPPGCTARLHRQAMEAAWGLPPAAGGRSRAARQRNTGDSGW